MRNARFFLFSASSLVVLAGGLSLSTATPASASVFACTSNQVTYVRSVITDVCGSDGGSARVVCDGADVDFVSVSCN